MPKRQQHGETFWRDHCRRWEGSQLSQSDYCAANKLSLKTFCRWRGVFKRKSALATSEPSSPVANATGFVPVHLVGGSALEGGVPQDDPSDIYLRLDGAPWVVRVRSVVDAATLARVLQAVELASR